MAVGLMAEPNKDKVTLATARVVPVFLTLIIAYASYTVRIQPELDVTILEGPDLQETSPQPTILLRCCYSTRETC